MNARHDISKHVDLGITSNRNKTNFVAINICIGICVPFERSTISDNRKGVSIIGDGITGRKPVLFMLRHETLYKADYEFTMEFNCGN